MTKKKLTDNLIEFGHNANNIRKEQEKLGWLWLFAFSCGLIVLFLYGIIRSVYASVSLGQATTLSIILFIVAVLLVILLFTSLMLLVDKKKIGKWLSIVTLTLTWLLVILATIKSLDNPELDSTRGTILSLIVLIMVWIFYFFFSERIKNHLIK